MKHSGITAFVSHSIFLTKEERYQLAEKNTLKVVGVSTPVWICNSKTTEPAIEVFCQYLFKFDEFNLQSSIKQTNYGYEIHLANCKNLLDVKDGGCEWIDFKHQRKLKKEGKNHNIIHIVELKPIEKLLETI